MLLFQKRFHEGLVSGATRVTFRRWQRARVKVGGRYRCHPIGVLEVDAVALVRLADVSEADAALAGFASREDLVAFLEELGEVSDETPLWRVDLHHGGDGDRADIALDDKIGPNEVAEIRAKLARLDRDGAWTLRTLRLIERHPRTAASQLAAKMKRERLAFKVDVRKLKRLGLTQSFEVGYELSPRGRAYLAAVSQKRKRRTS